MRTPRFLVCLDISLESQSMRGNAMLLPMHPMNMHTFPNVQMSEFINKFFFGVHFRAKHKPLQCIYSQILTSGCNIQSWSESSYFWLFFFFFLMYSAFCDSLEIETGSAPH